MNTIAPRTRTSALTVGIIGYGAIGQMLACAIATGRAGNAVLRALLTSQARPRADEYNRGALRTRDFRRFMACEMDLVIEAASQEAVSEYGRQVLRQGKDLMLMSVGALADDALSAELSALARQHQRQLLIPSGALGGLDALQAAALDELDEVTLTTTKPPGAISEIGGIPLPELAGLTAPRCLFEGPAAEAVARFPRNINVAAALSLATLGFRRTTVRLIADPDARHNTHRVQAKGRFGELDIELRLHPSPANPRTSHLAALSAIRLLRGLTEPVSLGQVAGRSPAT